MRKDFFAYFDSAPTLLRPLFDAADTPWELLSRLSDFLLKIANNPPAGFSLLFPGVIVAEGVKIEDFTTIKAPAVICRGAEVRQGAYLRGSVFLGEGAIAGHGAEMKNALLFDGAKAPHLSYLGDSILGKDAHLGAGVILSNLRLDKGEIYVKIGGKKIPTGCRKLGSIIGDGAEIACGTVLNPGTLIPKNSKIFP